MNVDTKKGEVTECLGKFRANYGLLQEKEANHFISGEIQLNYRLIMDEPNYSKNGLYATLGSVLGDELKHAKDYKDNFTIMKKLSEEQKEKMVYKTEKTILEQYQNNRKDLNKLLNFNYQDYFKPKIPFK